MHVCGVSASAFWNEECFGQTAVQNVLDRQLYRMFWTDSCTECFGQTAVQNVLDRQLYRKSKHIYVK